MSQLDNSMSFDWMGKPPSKSVDNKTGFSTPAGDADPLEHSVNDTPEDNAHDRSGVPTDGGVKTKTDMALTLEANKFPREKGHDSLSGDEVIFS